MAPYFNNAIGISDQPYVFAFIQPRGCLWQEFRIQPLSVWDSLVSLVDVELYMSGTPIVRHRIVSGDGDRNDNKTFNIGGLSGLATPKGNRIYLRLNAAGVPGHENDYLFHMWGKWNRDD